MLVRAYRSGAMDVSFQAVALEFDARDVFRSRCLIVYGPVRQVAVVAEALDANDDDALIANITQHVQDDLEELIVEGATWADHLLIARVAELLAHDGGDATLAAWNEIGRQVEAARKALGELDEQAVATVESAVDGYYALLDREGLRDEQVAASAHGREPKASMLTLILLLLALPFAGVGVLLYWLPYQAPRLVARSAAEPDVVSTYKLGTAVVLFPLWALALIATAAGLLGPVWATAAGIITVTSPFAVLLFADRSRPLRLGLRLSQRRRRLVPLLAARRRAMEVIRETQTLLEQDVELA
jgi:hypothetical protein